jgi:hypothetical protein
MNRCVPFLSAKCIPAAFVAAILAFAAAPARPASVVQVDFAPHFNADVVLNTSVEDFDPVGDSIEGVWSFSTESAGALSGVCDGPWLPDDGHFAATDAHPETQLGYSNDDDGPNVWQTAHAAGEITVQVPNLAYDTLFLYATGAWETSLTVTLNYTTGDPDSFAGIAFPSWFDPTPPGFFELVHGLDRAKLDDEGYSCEDVDNPGILGLAITVDPTRVLDSFTLERTDNDEGVLNVFGATAALARTVHNYDISSIFNADLVGNAPIGCAGAGSYDAEYDDFFDGGHLPTLTLSICAGTGRGLPDDGRFPAGGARPPFELAFSNADSGFNAYRRPPGLGDTTFVVDVTDAAVDEVHFFGAGGGGYTVLGIELVYTTGSPQLVGGGIILDSLFADGGEMEPAAYQLADGLPLQKSCGANCWYSEGSDAALFGLPVAADPNRVLDEIEITAYDPTGEPVPQSTLGLFGIAGVKRVDFYLYVDDFESGGLTGWSTSVP